MRFSRGVGPTLLIAAVCSTSVAGLWYWSSRPTAATLVAAAREASARGKYDEAVTLASRALERKSDSVEALLVAATAAQRAGEPERALEFYRCLPPGAEGASVIDALKTAGQLAIRLGRATDAEFFYKRALRLASDDLVIHRRLSALYLAQSRRWESAPHLFALVRGKSFVLEELAFLGNLEELYDAEEFMGVYEKSVPDDVAPLMGRARLYLFKNFPEEGYALLRQIIGKRPDLIEAQAQFGVVVVSESRDAEFLEWHRKLPPAADEHPEIWWVRATQARKQGDACGAIRCAWESLRRDPNHLGATYQLAQLLAAEGMPNEARVFAERAAKLELLATAIHEILLRKPTAERMLRCARFCEELGRLWEAWAWHVAVETYHPGDAVPEERERLQALLTPETPQTLPSHSLAGVFDLSHYPLPTWAPPEESVPSDGDDRLLQVRFEEVSGAIGLDFQYENGARGDKPGLMIYQSMGGGVAVLDYDRDGAPDLFFPQAGETWPPDKDSDSSQDRLYRNTLRRARDVTAAALPRDAGYGFGAAAGDYDCDGMPDLYVANAWGNRLLQNSGDGTFRDVTDAMELPAGEWTASTLIADLNGDGVPDLYNVNYCDGERPFEHVCLRLNNPNARTCIPTEFAAADDSLLVNLGDGRFEEATETAGILAPEGRGLGIVAANFDDEPGIDLYVANDMSANFLFLNRTPSPGGPPSFEERAVLSGCAYDSDGRPQASMGIAADDADGDGRIDLFLTHFYNESNTFYQQRPGGFFVDATRQFDLRSPSMETLGFGTQFLDAELDGWPDLVAANGHVDDYTDQNIPYRMKPQFFSNRGGTEFVEIPPERLGGFFEHAQIGRGLARLDWDRDGREDFVVSRLFEPASLVANRTPKAGNFVAIRLTGQLDRDAIGCEVGVTAGGRTLVKQMTAGDGYECSNQRQLVFGLGEAQKVDEVRIRWPGGLEEQFADVPIGREVLFVEGSGRAFVVPE